MKISLRIIRIWLHGKYPLIAIIRKRQPIERWLAYLQDANPFYKYFSYSDFEKVANAAVDLLPYAIQKRQ